MRAFMVAICCTRAGEGCGSAWRWSKGRVVELDDHAVAIEVNHRPERLLGVDLGEEDPAVQAI